MPSTYSALARQIMIHADAAARSFPCQAGAGRLIDGCNADLTLPVLSRLHLNLRLSSPAAHCLVTWFPWLGLTISWWILALPPCMQLFISPGGFLSLRWSICREKLLSVGGNIMTLYGRMKDWVGKERAPDGCGLHQRTSSCGCPPSRAHGRAPSIMPFIV
eukprot:6210864-Pleurochrysis_carterae.AAC.5